jgi:hypothetical protein
MRSFPLTHHVHAARAPATAVPLLLLLLQLVRLLAVCGCLCASTLLLAGAGSLVALACVLTLSPPHRQLLAALPTTRAAPALCLALSAVLLSRVMLHNKVINGFMLLVLIVRF